MAVIITNINAAVSENADSVIKKALKKAGLKETDTLKTGIYKTSLDARKQYDIHFVHSVYAELLLKYGADVKYKDYYDATEVKTIKW